jgi:transcriptional regulator with XRE-family HTH domain
LQTLVPTRGDQARMAERLGLPQPTVNRWLTGERQPKPLYRKKLEDEYGIPWTAWDEAPADDDEEPPASGRAVEQFAKGAA